MFRSVLLALCTLTWSVGSAQKTPCQTIIEKTQEVIDATTSFESKGSLTPADIAEYKNAYIKYRDFVFYTTMVDNDYDNRLILQAHAMAMATHYISELQTEQKFQEAWKESQLINEHLLIPSKYEQHDDRKDNWAGCVGNEQKIEIHEGDYRSFCTDFVAIACTSAWKLNKQQDAVELFATNAFRGILSDNPLLHGTAADILVKREKEGIRDDTSFLAAYYFLLTDSNLPTMANIMSDFANLSIAKALDVVTDPTIVERNDNAPLNKIDGDKNVSMRYEHLYVTLARDSGFTFPARFDILKIAVQHFLKELSAMKKIDNYFPPRLERLVQLVDDGFDKGGRGTYTISRQMEVILNSKDAELINAMAQLYEMYAKHSPYSYQDFVRYHYYYSAYRCYLALGDNGKANKAFDKISKDALTNAKKGWVGYQKLE